MARVVVAGLASALFWGESCCFSVLVLVLSFARRIIRKRVVAFSIACGFISRLISLLALSMRSQAQPCGLSIEPPNDAAPVNRAAYDWYFPPYDDTPADNPAPLSDLLVTNIGGVADGHYLGWCIDVTL